LGAGKGQTPRGDHDIVLTRVDAAGAVRWTRTTGGNDDERGMMSVELPGGGFASVGYRRTAEADWDMWSTLAARRRAGLALVG